MKLKYRRAAITIPDVPDVRTGRCVANHPCAKTDLHHWLNRYPTKQVRKNPTLALEDTVEVDFTCHRVCNALRLICEFAVQHPDRLAVLLNSMPRGMRAVFSHFPTRRLNSEEAK